MSQTRYVAGFAFGGDKVALVVKNRPKWQEGKMNGIGGHIEEGETPLQAMVREFREETGMETHELDWIHFATLSNDHFEVSFFNGGFDLSKLKTTTDEEIVIVPIRDVTVDNSIPNLTWLIPMAWSLDQDSAERFDIKEIA